LETICQDNNISFNAINAHCRCITHIMNISVQEILNKIKVGEIQIEDDILSNIDINLNTGEIIPKVYLFFL
jgi:hypothetical protein